MNKQKAIFEAGSALSNIVACYRASSTRRKEDVDRFEAGMKDTVERAAGLPEAFFSTLEDRATGFDILKALYKALN